MGDWNRSHYEASSDGGAADLVRGSHGLHRDELHVRHFGCTLRCDDLHMYILTISINKVSFPNLIFILLLLNVLH